MDSIVISLDEAIRVYERYKRKEKNSIIEIVYSVSDHQFQKMNDQVQPHNDHVQFINCHKTCLNIINAYLSLPAINEYKQGCEIQMAAAKDPVVAFLWFFEHIDGAYDFELFEETELDKILKKWCLKNRFAYCDRKEKRLEIPSFLTDKRCKV